MWRFLKKLFLILFIGQFVYIIILKWVNPPLTITQLSNWFSGYGLKRDYVSWEEMSKNARLAVIASEDQLFADHNGFDWKSIEKAMEYNTRKPNRVRGASTISQQTAKNVFLWQSRGWVRKGFETYFTFMIELVWGKQRILEVYLNVIEMGPGIFGIEAASQKYFKKPAKSLTRAEAARIAACLPNPKKFKVQPASKYVIGRSVIIQRQMNNLAGDKEIAAIVE
ncbi:monofunctional biosynthetic peptidoglycan transglycosylase [Flavihumibacter stibioxidans]|uniref:Biosynthetic peptidoglycan transglycosylase n=1 Tax=Flavihumibacter stibioxidans TaxID=1834163 RepID=A0ABR7MD30_9BACT|nr:monofunctional biosynthetic peptidoglycan transglycosylase [Flavihumibacter stibioxidans]